MEKKSAPLHMPSPDIAGAHQQHISPYGMASRVLAGLRFFNRRGKLDLTRDTAQHRRYAFLYEDMMN